jgi:hypothetical protein
VDQRTPLLIRGFDGQRVRRKPHVITQQLLYEYKAYCATSGELTLQCPGEAILAYGKIFYEGIAHTCAFRKVGSISRSRRIDVQCGGDG